MNIFCSLLKWQASQKLTKLKEEVNPGRFSYFFFPVLYTIYYCNFKYSKIVKKRVRKIPFLSYFVPLHFRVLAVPCLLLFLESSIDFISALTRFPYTNLAHAPYCLNQASISSAVTTATELNHSWNYITCKAVSRDFPLCRSWMIMTDMQRGTE